jgi:hypothetical protein
MMGKRVNWLGNTPLTITKAVIGTAVMDYVVKGERRTILTRYNQRNKNKICEIVGGCFPDGIRYLEESGFDGTILVKNGEGKMASFDHIANLLQGRANACLPWVHHGVYQKAGEMERFLRAEFNPYLEIISNSYMNDKPFDMYDIANAQDKFLRLQFGQGPGFYVRQDPENRNLGYAGCSEWVKTRTHTNAHHHLIVVKAVETQSAAKQLENHFFDIWKLKYKVETEGRLILPKWMCIAEAAEEIFQMPSFKYYFHSNIRHVPDLLLPLPKFYVDRINKLKEMYPTTGEASAL